MSLRKFLFKKLYNYTVFVFLCPNASSLCLVYSRRESYLINANKTRAHLYSGALGFFQTHNSNIMGIESEVSDLD